MYSDRIEDKRMNGHFFGNGSKEITEDEQNVRCDVSFSFMTKYICSRALKEVMIESAFGSVTVYFDGAILDNGDIAFGSVEIHYI